VVSVSCELNSPDVIVSFDLELRDVLAPTITVGPHDVAAAEQPVRAEVVVGGGARPSGARSTQCERLQKEKVYPVLSNGTQNVDRVPVSTMMNSCSSVTARPDELLSLVAQ
jgi:hypothetical protein